MAAEEAAKTKEISAKNKRFADFYVGAANLHSTNAAIMAGYSKRSAYSTGYDLLRRPEVRAYINERLETVTLGKSEVLTRLTQIANASVEDFFDENGRFDYRAAKKANKLGLVKKLKMRTVRTGSEFDADTSYYDVEFELYSAHEALRDLGKYHNLFSNKVELTGADGEPLMAPIADALMQFEKALLKVYDGDGDKTAED